MNFIWIAEASLLTLTSGYIGAVAGFRRVVLLSIAVFGLIGAPYTVLRFYSELSGYLYPYIEKPLADGLTMAVMAIVFLIVIGQAAYSLNSYLFERLRSRELDTSLGTVIGLSIGYVLSRLLLCQE